MDDLRKQSPEMAKAAEGYKLVTPQVEYQEKMTLQLGGKTIEILRLNNVHSEADSAIWLPQDRVLFAASATGPRRLNNIRPVVNVSDILAAVRMMKALNPEVVIPGHGAPSTTQMFDDIEKYYALLFERVGAKVREGKSLDQIKQEVKMPEYASWANQDRLPNNIEAAFRALRGRPN
jgi:cyclase